MIANTQSHTKHLLGQSRSQIISTLIGSQAHYIEFARWLYLPSFGLLLSFDKQVCRAVLPLTSSC